MYNSIRENWRIFKKYFWDPGELTNEDLKKIEGFEIKVIGHGIQATGFKSADEAWNAFDEQEQV